MPSYEFQCPKCDKVSDSIRPREKAGTQARCPIDGAVSRRIFSAAVVGAGAITGESGFESAIDGDEFGGDDLEDLDDF